MNKRQEVIPRLPEKLGEDGMTYRAIVCRDCAFNGFFEPLAYITGDEGYLPENKLKQMLQTGLCPRHAKESQELEQQSKERRGE